MSLRAIRCPIRRVTMLIIMMKEIVWMIAVKRVGIKMPRIIWNHILEIIMHIIYRLKMGKSLKEVIRSSRKILNMDSLNLRIRSFLSSWKETMISIRLILYMNQLTSKIRVIKIMISKIIRQSSMMGIIRERQETMMM